MARRFIPRMLLLIPAALLAASGCQDDGVRTYSVPKEGAARPAAPAPTRAPAAAVDALPTWDLPAGWQQREGSGMRYATVVMGEGDEAPEIRVTPLGIMAGDVLPNVNRWREQLSLGPIDESGLASVLTKIQVDGQEADLVRIVSDESTGEEALETLAAIVRTEDRAWFFMSMGPRAQIEPHEDAFREFVGSIRMQAPVNPHAMASTPAGEVTNPHATASSGETSETGSLQTGDGELAWTLPPGWSQVPNSSTMRIATFQVDDAEFTITKFPGSVGGLLANVNRWRGQLGLDPVTDLSNQEQEAVNVAGSPGMLLDLAPRNAAAADTRMFVTLVPRGDFTWFLKLTGRNELLEDEAAHYRSLIDSIELPEVN